jgi:hypothetical protein
MWQTIGMFPDYEACRDGRIRSKSRERRFGKQIRTVPSQEIRPFNHSCGYLCVKLAKDRKKTNKYVHRLVASVFIANPDALPEVNHKDGNRKNNHVNNLEWVNRRENLAHARDVLKRGAGTASDKRKRFTKVTAETVRQIRASDKTAKELSLIYGCSVNCVRRIRNNVTWKNQS